MTKDEFVFKKLEMGCWHEVSNCYGPSLTGYGKLCAHCKSALFDVVGNELMPDNPTFIERNGMVMLVRRIDELGRWGDFYYYSWRSYFESLTKEERYIKFACDHTNWLINPPRFLDLVADWLGYQEEGGSDD